MRCSLDGCDASLSCGGRGELLRSGCEPRECGLVPLPTHSNTPKSRLRPKSPGTAARIFPHAPGAIVVPFTHLVFFMVWGPGRLACLFRGLVWDGSGNVELQLLNTPYRSRKTTTVLLQNRSVHKPRDVPKFHSAALLRVVRVCLERHIS